MDAYLRWGLKRLVPAQYSREEAGISVHRIAFAKRSGDVSNGKGYRH